MAAGKPWSRDELLLIMNLYCRIPFGRQHQRSPEVIQLASVLGRTPSSVAMKMNNFTSLDPKEKSRGVRGLSGASKLDLSVWNEFHSGWENMAEESESLWQNRVEGQIKTHAIPDDFSISKCKDSALVQPSGPTEGRREVSIRLSQRFFRRTVLIDYSVRCCISGIQIPELLIASHILPWADFPEHRINPSNGLCLSRMHDAAFDQGLIAFDENMCVLLSKRFMEFLPNDAIEVNFSAYEGKPLRLPEKFHPSREFLAKHREMVFQG
ncbi:MAG: HNH endonuclease [Magnetococcales bacterium]|nr:HNH endonuclease [Magnetococcales bacterium]